MVLTLSGIIVGGCMGAVLSFIKYLADAETTLSAVTSFFGTIIFVVLLFVRRDTIREND